jgi:ATP-dependent Clp protease adaptor protein ClpS
LIEIFKYTPETAEQITWDVHSNGSAIVAVLPYELAEQKGSEVLTAARENQYPLQVRLEPDVSE